MPKPVASEAKPQDETMTVKKSDIEYLKREIKRWQDAYMELALTVAGGKRDTSINS